MKKIIFFLIVCVFPMRAQQSLYDSVLVSIAHRPSDERFRIMEQYADSLITRPYEALPFTHEAARLANLLGDKREEGYLLNSLSRIYQKIGEFDRSGDYVRMGLTLNREVKHDYEIARGYSIVANSYYYMGLYYSAMEFDLKALAIYQQLQKPARVASVFNSIGSIYLRLGQYGNAREYFSRSLATLGRKDTSDFVILVNTNLASIYTLQGNPDSALPLLQSFLSITRRNRSQGTEAYVLYCIGRGLMEKHRFAEALRYLQESRCAAAATHEAYGEAEALIGIAAVHSHKGDHRKALAVLEEAVPYCRRVKTYDLLLASLKLRCAAYEALGDVRRAHASLKDYSALTDSVSRMADRIGIANAIFSSDLARKEEEIARLRKDAEADGESIRNQRILIYMLAVFTLIIAGGSLALIFMYRKANRLRRTEEEQKQKIETLYDQLTREMDERRIADEQTHVLQQRFKSIWEMSVDGMRLTDKDGTIVMVNESFCRMVGMKREELEGRPLSVMYDPRDSEKIILHYKEQFYGGRIEAFFERELRLRNGSSIWFEVTNTYITGTGQKALLLGIFRDTTQRKKLEHQLVQAQKLEGIGTLAGGIAHDFNNLLAMILGSAELLQTRIGGDPQLLRCVDRIIQASTRGSSISRQLLMFSRPDQSERKPISLSQSVADLCEMLTHFLPKSIEIRTVIEAEYDIVLGDAGQIQQALLNLAINAGDAMKGTGTLTIREFSVSPESMAEKFIQCDPGPYIGLSVTDTGMGMTDSVRSKIFDPFFTTKERSKGTGLGLSSVHGIIKHHGGFIDVESAVGTGSTFTLYFPAENPSKIRTF